MNEGFRGFKGKSTGPCHSCYRAAQLSNGYCNRCKVKFRLGTPQHAMDNLEKLSKKETPVKKVATKTTKTKKTSKK